MSLIKITVAYSSFDKLPLVFTGYSAFSMFLEIEVQTIKATSPGITEWLGAEGGFSDIYLSGGEAQ